MTRGMDVEGVTNVINYDMPAYIKTYIHRAGRTARAGQSGHCITLLKKDEVWTFFCIHLSFSAFVSLEKSLYTCKVLITENKWFFILFFS